MLFAFACFNMFNTSNSPFTFLTPNTDSNQLTSLKNGKSEKEVFGFAPYWNIKKLDNVDFSVLTTFAYFGVPVLSDGSLDTEDIGYTTFESKKATELFKKAHDNGTRVVLTLTQMDNDTITAFLDDPAAQNKLITDSVHVVAKRGIDGINVDFEYVGNPGEEYRKEFTSFVKNLTSHMHSTVPGSKVTVSVYASAVKDPKMYEVGELSKHSDGIFMMAYDFATTSSDNAIPTSPLYGHKEGKYWYDVSSAVDDFLTQMPANKLILGLPWYGYNYPVDTPSVKTATQQGYYTYYWYRYRQYSQYVAPPDSMAQTYASTKREITPSQVESYTTGWDDFGKVGYLAYKENGSWRMVFIEDERSLGIKYDFAKAKGLGGVGMWALGFDAGRTEMWTLLSKKFGPKLANNYIESKKISDIE